MSKDEVQWANPGALGSAAFGLSSYRIGYIYN